MKQHYQVEVQERYTKFVDVYVEDESMIEDEIAAMEESGEIEWDRADDFECWDILSYGNTGYTEAETAAVKKWCRDMVSVTAIVDPDWVVEEMDEYQCQDWLEQMRDRGVSIPIEVTSSDLWDAVEAYRKQYEYKEEK